MANSESEEVVELVVADDAEAEATMKFNSMDVSEITREEASKDESNFQAVTEKAPADAHSTSKPKSAQSDEVFIRTLISSYSSSFAKPEYLDNRYEPECCDHNHSVKTTTCQRMALNVATIDAVKTLTIFGESQT